MKPLAILLEINDFGEEEYSHPYEFELERFTPNERFLTVNTQVLRSKNVNETPLLMVTTENDLQALLADLRNHKEIAVDLEVTNLSQLIESKLNPKLNRVSKMIF